MTPKQQADLAVFARAAVSVERSSAAWLARSYPAEVMVAQWGAETQLSFDKITGDFNLFGLTAATWPALPKKFCPTHEDMTVERFETLPADERASVTARKDLGGGRYRYWLNRWFACFPSLPAGNEAYVRTITAPGHRYAAAWAHYVDAADIDDLMDGIAKAGYASAGGYAALLKDIAHEGPVAAAIAVARLL